MASPDSENSLSPLAPKLGVGKIISATFLGYLSNFLILFPVPFFIHLLEQSFIFFVENRITLSVLSESFEVSSGVMLIELSLIYCVKSILFTVLTLAAFDLTFGNGVKIVGYFRTAITHFFPMLMLYLGYIFCTSLSFLLLIVPGLYLMAMWSVYLPATLTEQLSSGSFDRSADLTEHYRWPIVVPIAVFIGVSIAIYASVALMLGIGTDDFLVPDTANEWWQFVLINSISDSIGEGIFAVGGVVIYCRLIEIKGGDMNNAISSEVFD